MSSRSAAPEAQTECRVLPGGQSFFAAFGLGTEGDKERHPAQRISQAVQAAGEGGGVQHIGKPVGPPFHTIRVQGGKRGGLFQDRGFALRDDGQNDLGTALSDPAAPHDDTRHNRHSLYSMICPKHTLRGRRLSSLPEQNGNTDSFLVKIALEK